MTNGDSFAALGSPIRRNILEHLAAGPLSVGELSRHFPVSRPAVSQHLKVLEDAGLVLSEPRGTRRLYRVNREAIAEMRAYLDRFWDINLAAFKQAVEKEPSQ